LSDEQTPPPESELQGRTIGDIIIAALPSAPLQALFESLSQAQLVRIGNKRTGPQQTRITFTTPMENFTPNNAMWLSLSQMERDDSDFARHKPPFVPVIVWIPIEEWERK
jgi:hypothetical protein